MATITFEVPTNADAVWWMELGKRVGQKMEVVFDAMARIDDTGGNSDFHKKSFQYQSQFEVGKPSPKILRYCKQVKKGNPKNRK